MIKKFLDKKIIFTGLGIIIFAELVWASWMIFKPKQIPSVYMPEVSQQIQETVEGGASVSLTTDNSKISVGNSFSVFINMTSNQVSDGADIIITYDPKLLSVDLSGGNKEPVILGGIYNEYPQNKADPKSGRIAVSGISSISQSSMPNGLFGSIVFKALKKGNTKISVEFEKGRTEDSNITSANSGKDILNQVSDLEVIIQ